MYRMYWKNKKNPDEQGEGRAVGKEDSAFKLCKKHNELFPNYHHWYELEDKQQKQEDNGTRN